MPQPLLPFDDPPADAPPAAPPPAAAVQVSTYNPSPQAQAALEQLQQWLTDPRTGKPTDLGQEAIDALQKALVNGWNGWVARAEDALEQLARQNGRDQGPDIGQRLDGDFQQVVEDLQEALSERLVRKAR